MTNWSNVKRGLNARRRGARRRRRRRSGPGCGRGRGAGRGARRPGATSSDAACRRRGRPPCRRVRTREKRPLDPRADVVGRLDDERARLERARRRAARARCATSSSPTAWRSSSWMRRQAWGRSSSDTGARKGLLLAERSGGAGDQRAGEGPGGGEYSNGPEARERASAGRVRRERAKRA